MTGAILTIVTIPRILVGLLVAAFLANAQAGLLDAALYPGKVTSFYASVDADSEDGKLMQGIREGRLAENLSGLTQQAILLRHNLAVGVAKCNQTNAFYKASAKSITICLELIRFVLTTAKERGLLDKPKGAEFASGVLMAIYAHELGHALIDINRIPITGREEDVADQFGTYFSLHVLEPAHAPTIGPAVWFYSMLAKQGGAVNSRTDEQFRRLMSDEHSLDMQRVFNVACWAYGYDQRKGAKMVEAIGMSDSRKVRCPAESARMDGGIRSLFGPSLRRIFR